MLESQFTKMQLITIAIQILAIIIQVFCIFISYYLGSKKDKQEYILRIKEERYNNFYFPYIRLLYSIHAWDFASCNQPKCMKDFDTIISENIRHLDEKTISLCEDFSSAYIYFSWFYAYCVEPSPEVIPSETEASKIYDTIFFTIGYSILLEAQSIASELDLPIITKPFLKIFSDRSQGYNNLKVPKPDFP